MPTYEYRCPKGHDFEKFYSRISEAEATLACPECGEVAERRISGGAGLLFKGSGFYLTDYGKNAHRKSTPDKKPAGGSESSGGGKSESSGTSSSGGDKSSGSSSSSSTGSGGGGTGGTGGSKE